MKDRVLRGGSVGSDSRFLPAARRIGNEPEVRNWLYGFRVVFVQRRKR